VLNDQGDKNLIVLPKLSKIYFAYLPEDSGIFGKFTDIYGKILRAIHVTIDYSCDVYSISELMANIEKVPSLYELTIKFDLDYSKGYLLPNQLRQIGVNCRKLRKLSLNIHVLCNSTMTQIVQALNDNFPRLICLTFTGVIPYDYHLDSHTFGKCKHLTSLSFPNMTTNSKLFITNIATQGGKIG